MFMIKWHKLPVGLLNSMRADLMESLAWGTAGAADQVDCTGSVLCQQLTRLRDKALLGGYLEDC